MSLKPEIRYPNRRTFVLKLRSDAKRRQLAGRLENLVTGRQSEFANGRELLTLIVRELESEGDPHGQG